MEPIIFCINRGPAFEQQRDDVNFRNPTRPMEGRLTVVVARRRIDAPVEKEPCCVQAAVYAGVEEPRLDLSWIRVGPARTTFIEIGLKHVESAHCRSSFRIQRCAEIRKKLGRGGRSIGDAAMNEGMVFAGRRRVLKIRAPVQQCPEESNLDAGSFRMGARRN